VTMSETSVSARCEVFIQPMSSIEPGRYGRKRRPQSSQHVNVPTLRESSTRELPNASAWSRHYLGVKTTREGKKRAAQDEITSTSILLRQLVR